MLFPQRPITLDDVRAFCATFDEGYRVEYKSVLDASVRGKIPKVIASFGNSNGGVLVIGVSTVNGVAQPPFEGFLPSSREEFALTIENICLQEIYPPLLPQTTVVKSDVAGKVFVIIEVDESAQAPHAIENSRKVYVRTGNASNPYDLADVELVLELVKRRNDPQERAERIIKFAEERAVFNIAPRELASNKRFMQVSICPQFPRIPLCSTQEIWDFVSHEPYRGGRFFPRGTAQRIPEGAASVIHSKPPSDESTYAEVNKYGLVMARQTLAQVAARSNPSLGFAISFSHLFREFLRLTVCAERFYKRVGYRGALIATLSLHNVGNLLMQFESDSFTNPLENCRCYADTVSTQRFVDSVDLGTPRFAAFTDMLAEIIWSFWQSNDPFPATRFAEYVHQSIGLMGHL